jgi:DDE superfamily endonuclease
MQATDMRSLSPEALHERRVRVIRLRETGLGYAETAAQTGLSRTESPSAVKKWLEQDYPAIAARAKAEGAEIHWGDESGLRSDDVRGRSYAPIGKTPVVRINNKRHGLSVISTVTNKGQMRWKIFDGALNADLKQAVTKLAPARTRLQLVKATARPLKVC